MRNQRSRFTSCATLAAALLAWSLAPPVDAGVVESYWITDDGDFGDPINWSGPVPDESVTAIFDLDLEYGPFVHFQADAVSDRIVIRDGNVYFFLWDLDETGEMVSRAVEVMNANVTTPSIVVGETPGVDTTLHIDEGYVTTQTMVIGQGAGALATVDFDTGLFDLSAGLTCELQLHVGGSGDGLLVIDSDVNVTTDALLLGLEPGSFGEITVTDPQASLVATGDLTVGLGGSGAISVSNQNDFVSGHTLIGQQPGSSGAVTLTGLGASWTINGPLDVGFQGQGTVTITDGVLLTDGYCVLGSYPDPGPEPVSGGTGEVTISGPTAFWGINGDLYVGLLWEGSLNVYDGAAVASDNGYINVDSDRPCQVTLDGPGSAWSNIGELVVAGTLHVSDGAIVIADAMDLQDGAVLEGDGTVQASIDSLGTIRPGAPVGALHVSGGLITDGVLEIEITSPDPGGFDSIAVMGDAAVGGTLTVTTPGGYEPQLGDTFEILTADAVSGDFAETTLPALPSPLLWFVNRDDHSITLRVSHVGDIDGDGIVGVTDFLALLAAWGPCPGPPDPCYADLDGNGSVGVEDFLLLLSLWD